MKENKIMKVIIILALITAFPINIIDINAKQRAINQKNEYTNFIKYVNEVTSTNIQEEKFIHSFEYEKAKKLKEKLEKENKEKRKEQEKEIYSNVIVPYPHSDFKTWEDYRCITDINSEQYQLQTYAYTGEYGIRKINDYYLVAMGSAYAHYIGEKIELKFSTGETIKVIIGDFKQDQHTDKYNSAGVDNNDIIEFIVDQSITPSEVWLMGSYDVVFQGTVDEIRYIK